MIPILLALFASVLSSVFFASDIPAVAADRPWRKLLHYETGIFGTTSQVDGKSFFLSPEGKENPEAELRATLSAFKTVEPAGDDHAICRFPARRIFLKKALGLKDSDFASPKCAKWDEFRNRIAIQSATMIFSSFYLNNPSSAFGHSLLRLNSSRSVDAAGQRHELLDFGVNYAAVVTSENPLVYFAFGMTGGFRGTFTGIPYYYKVREYNDYEARDLWTYDLELAPDELEMLVAHVWELGQTYYDYYYFTENCSYHMFSTLEAAAPRLHLVDRLPFYVIPSDTMRAIREPGFVKSILYRPSVRTQFEYRLTRLSDIEKDALAGVVRDAAPSSLPEHFETASKARVLDAALDYLEFKNPQDIIKSDSKTSQYKQALLMQRARLAVRSEEVKVPPPSREMPHLGHGVRRFSLGGGYEESVGTFSRVGMRFAMTDLTDPSLGYPRGAQIEFMNLNARYEHDTRHFWLEEATMFRIASLTSLTRFRSNTSFRAEFGYKTMMDRNCNRCGALNLEGGLGYAGQLGDTRTVTFFSFADFQGAYSGGFEGSSFRVGVGPTVGALLTASDDLKGLISAGYRYLGFSVHPHDYEAKAEVTYGFSAPWALSARGIKRIDTWEAGGSLMVFW